MLNRQALLPVLAAVLLPASLFAQSDAAPAPPAELSAEEVKNFSYVVGRDLGANIKGSGLSPDLASLTRGLQSALNGEASTMTDADKQQVMARVQAVVAAKKAVALAELGAKVAGEGEAYLASNARRSGVKTTASGLQYEVLTALPKKAKPERPLATDRVKVHYKGTLTDGEVFDSSFERGEPASFQLDSVIPGWTEALQLMAVGENYRIVLPSKLAYGDRGAGTKVPPNSVLTFEVELLAIEK